MRLRLANHDINKLKQSIGALNEQQRQFGLIRMNIISSQNNNNNSDDDNDNDNDDDNHKNDGNEQVWKRKIDVVFNTRSFGVGVIHDNGSQCALIVRNDSDEIRHVSLTPEQ